MWWTVFILATIISINSTLSNPTTRQPVILDYKTLCGEKLFKCVYNSVTLSTVTAGSLAAVVDPFDLAIQNATTVVVEISTSQRTLDFHNELDIFLVSRPQWFVREWPAHCNNNDVGLKSIVLQHLSQELEHSYSYITKVSFPSDKSSCKERAFCVDFIDGTWGNGFINMAGHYDFCSRAVFAPFTSRTGNGHDRVFLADEFACPHTVNKWECLFLPSTTCTWPNAITNCHARECLPIDEKVHFSSASASGTSISREGVQSAMVRHSSPVKTYKLEQAPMAYTSDKKNNAITSETVQWGKIDSPDAHNLFALYGVFTRFNSIFGGLVQEAIHDFRSTRTLTGAVFRPDQTCVAVHVRRDDRALPGEDMMAWCKNRTIIDSDGHKSLTGLWINGVKYELYEPLSYGQWADMGCGAQLPYGAATLEHFLNASKALLPHNKNVFMLTDDPKWLKAEIKKYYVNNRKAHGSHAARNSTIMNIFTPSIRPNHRGGTFNSSVDFWASIAVARQCQALVGHRGSAAFDFILKNLCYFHDNKFLHCPPVFSIGGP